MHDLKNIKSIFIPFYLKYVKRRLFEVTEELPAGL